MNVLQELSGPWAGFWIQSRTRGYMRLRLEFAAKKVSGGGSDFIGPFKIRGSFTLDGQVSFRKTYRSHFVHYHGRWDGQMISGSWRIWGEDSGAFEIWPEVEGCDINFEKIEEPEVVAGAR